MKLKALIPIFALVAKAWAGDALEIIKTEGHLDFSDGTSIYSFSSSDAFQMTPIGMSGPTINGTWKNQDGAFVITGQWSYQNGVCEPNDFRTMVMFVTVIQKADLSPEHNKEMISATGFTPRKVTKHVQFRIQDVTKIKIPIRDFTQGYQGVNTRNDQPFSPSAIDCSTRDAFSVIEQEGILSISDGRFIYEFHKDGFVDMNGLRNDEANFVSISDIWQRVGDDFVIHGMICRSGIQVSPPYSATIRLHVSPVKTALLVPIKEKTGYWKREVTVADVQIIEFTEKQEPVLPLRPSYGFNHNTLSMPSMPFAQKLLRTNRESDIRPD